MPADEFWKKEKGPETTPVSNPTTPRPCRPRVSGPLAGRPPQAVESGLRRPDGRHRSKAARRGADDFRPRRDGPSPIRTLPLLRKLDVSGYWDPAEKKEYRSALGTLAPLRGLKLEALRVHHTSVATSSRCGA